jgi:hypothetical protein
VFLGLLGVLQLRLGRGGLHSFSHCTGLGSMGT